MPPDLLACALPPDLLACAWILYFIFNVFNSEQHYKSIVSQERNNELSWSCFIHTLADANTYHLLNLCCKLLKGCFDKHSEDLDKIPQYAPLDGVCSVCLEKNDLQRKRYNNMSREMRFSTTWYVRQQSLSLTSAFVSRLNSIWVLSNWLNKILSF